MFTTFYKIGDTLVIMNVKILAIYKKRDDIRKILGKIKGYSFDNFKRTPYFKMSILEKATDIDLLRKTFPKFNLIETIELRENERGQQHYGFNYELPDGTFLVISLALDKIPPLIINGYHKKINYKRFEKSLRKNYSRKFMGLF